MSNKKVHTLYETDYAYGCSLSFKGIPSFASSLNRDSTSEWMI